MASAEVSIGTTRTMELTCFLCHKAEWNLVDCSDGTEQLIFEAFLVKIRLEEFQKICTSCWFHIKMLSTYKNIGPTNITTSGAVGSAVKYGCKRTCMWTEMFYEGRPGRGRPSSIGLSKKNLNSNKTTIAYMAEVKELYERYVFDYYDKNQRKLNQQRTEEFTKSVRPEHLTLPPNIDNKYFKCQVHLTYNRSQCRLAPPQSTSGRKVKVLKTDTTLAAGSSPSAVAPISVGDRVSREMARQREATEGVIIVFQDDNASKRRSILSTPEQRNKIHSANDKKRVSWNNQPEYIESLPLQDDDSDDTDESGMSDVEIITPPNKRLKIDLELHPRKAALQTLSPNKGDEDDDDNESRTSGEKPSVLPTQSEAKALVSPILIEISNSKIEGSLDRISDVIPNILSTHDTSTDEMISTPKNQSKIESKDTVHPKKTLQQKLSPKEQGRAASEGKGKVLSNQKGSGSNTPKSISKLTSNKSTSAEKKMVIKFKLALPTPAKRKLKLSASPTNKLSTDKLRRQFGVRFFQAKVKLAIIANMAERLAQPLNAMDTETESFTRPLNVTNISNESSMLVAQEAPVQTKSINDINIERPRPIIGINNKTEQWDQNFINKNIQTQPNMTHVVQSPAPTQGGSQSSVVISDQDESGIISLMDLTEHVNKIIDNLVTDANVTNTEIRGTNEDMDDEKVATPLNDHRKMNGNGLPCAIVTNDEKDKQNFLSSPYSTMVSPTTDALYTGPKTKGSLKQISDAPGTNGIENSIFGRTVADHSTNNTLSTINTNNGCNNDAKSRINNDALAVKLDSNGGGQLNDLNELVDDLKTIIDNERNLTDDRESPLIKHRQDVDVLNMNDIFTNTHTNASSPQSLADIDGIRMDLLDGLDASLV